MSFPRDRVLIDEALKRASIEAIENAKNIKPLPTGDPPGVPMRIIIPLKYCPVCDNKECPRTGYIKFCEFKPKETTS